MKNEVKSKSRRKALRDISNSGGRFCSCEFKEAILLVEQEDDQSRALEEDNMLDCLLLPRSNLFFEFFLIHQVIGTHSAKKYRDLLV